MNGPGADRDRKLLPNLFERGIESSLDDLLEQSAMFGKFRFRTRLGLLGFDGTGFSALFFNLGDGRSSDFPFWAALRSDKPLSQSAKIRARNSMGTAFMVSFSANLYQNVE